jgi:hypothetical protein
MLREAVTEAEIERALRQPPGWFRRHWGWLRRKHRFPLPLPLPGRDRRWDPLAIERWMDGAQGAPAQPAGIFPRAAANDAAEADPWAALLDRRAAALDERG